jgi:two-component system sensor histidine kinase PilS (NtrC family)
MNGGENINKVTEGEKGTLAAPSQSALRWVIGLRLVVISTLFLGVVIIQINTQQLLNLKHFYGLILLTYGLSLGYLALYLRQLSTRFQAVIQLLGDIAVVTGLVYFTGGIYSPFSFLYLTVIVTAGALLRGGGLVYAGLSAIAYGVLTDLMVFGVLEIPPNLSGVRVPPPVPRVLYQILIHVVGFILVAILVSYLAESLRSAHYRLEEEKERTKQFAAITDHVIRSVTAGILATDLDGELLYLNPAGARILGVDNPDHATGERIEIIMPVEGIDWCSLVTRARTQHTASVRLEGRLGAATLLGLTTGPLQDGSGRTVGLIVNFQNLSELEIETERRRMQERMAAIGEMAARMAHEIKNPLASISGSAQMLMSIEGVNSTARRLLTIVVDESKRLSSILDNFLDYARPSRGTQRECDLSALLRDCVDLLRRSAELRDDHRLILDVPQSTTILGEEHLLRQVFWNLSRNALQAMPQGGRLSIRAERSADAVILRWIDNGVGMPEEVRKRAFEPFITTHPGGTGLGLAVVYSAVHQHAGTIDIESSEGRGTTVTVVLPIEQERV